MKTYLDTIVEEGLVGLDTVFDTKTGGERLLALQRIAERAFAHGVGQGLSAPPTAYLSEVQPAPAEEKHYCSRCKHESHDGKMCLFMVVCGVGTGQMYTPTGTCNCGDRRKKERRIDRRFACTCGRGLSARRGAFGTPFCCNKRILNDRRKP